MGHYESVCIIRFRLDPHNINNPFPGAPFFVTQRVPFQNSTSI